MMQYKEGIKYPISELNSINEWWQNNRQYDINEYLEAREYDENGNKIFREYDDYVEIVPRDEGIIRDDRIHNLKAELAKIKEDIEQEAFGLVRDDYAEKKARAAEIINELRVLEGKEPREVKNEDD